MSSSNPGPVRRFFRGAWRVVDVSRRVVLNLLFMIILIAVIIAFAKSGPLPLADKTALVLRIDGTIGEQKSGNLRSTALDQVRGEAVQKVQLRDVLNALDAAAEDPKITSLVVVLDEMRPTGLLDAARDRRRDRPLQGERQEGRRLGLGLRPAPVLRRRARRRGLPASARHGLHRRLREPAQLLQGRARQARRHRQRRPRRHLQERGRAVHRQRAVGAGARGRQAALRRSLEDVRRRGREGEEASRRIDHARHRRGAAAPRRGRRRRCQARARRKARRRAEDARRAAHADDRARREGRRREHLSPDLVRRLPRPRPAARHGRCDRRRRRRGRDRRRPGAGGNDRRPVDRQPDQEGARQQGREGAGPARRLAGRQPVRIGARPP